MWSMQKRLSSVAFSSALLGVGITTGACSFDPGHDYAVTSTWLLNGATPDATRCAELGITEFRLTMNGPGPATKLSAACDETLRIEGQTYGGFETTRSFDFGVEYVYTVDALNSKGTELFGYESSVVAYYGDFIPVDLDTVDIFEPRGKTASFSAQWVFSENDIQADCEKNQVEDVEIWIASATDPDFLDPLVLSKSTCADGSFKSDGKVLARGEYFFRYVALDDRGAIAELGDALFASVGESGDLALPRQKWKGL